VLVFNYFDISKLDYVGVSAQMQWQNVMRLRRTRWLCGLRCSSAEVSFLGYRVWITITARQFVFIFWGGILCISCSLRPKQRAGHCGGGFLLSVCLCLTVCGQETATNSHPSPEFECSTTERKEHKVYLQTLELQSPSSSRSSTVRLFQSCGLL